MQNLIYHYVKSNIKTIYVNNIILVITKISSVNKNKYTNNTT